MVLLGNKGDMVHLRQVSSEEGDYYGFWTFICQTQQKNPQIVRRQCCVTHFYWSERSIGINLIQHQFVYLQCLWLAKFSGIRPLAFLRDPHLAHFYFWTIGITRTTRRETRGTQGVFTVLQRGSMQWPRSDKNIKCCKFYRLSYTGEILSKDFDCNFGEVAAADQVVEVGRWFKKIIATKFCQFIILPDSWSTNY